MIQEIKAKIGLELLPAFMIAMNASNTIEDLQTHSKSLIENFRKLIWPKHNIEITPI